MKLEINNRKKFGKFTNMQKLNNILLNNQRVKEEITKEIRKYYGMNENEDTTYQNVCDSVKAALRGKFMTPNAPYLKRRKVSGLPWRSSGWDAVLPLQGAWV